MPRMGQESEQHHGQGYQCWGQMQILTHQLLSAYCSLPLLEVQCLSWSSNGYKSPPPKCNRQANHERHKVLSTGWNRRPNHQHKLNLNIYQYKHRKLKMKHRRTCWAETILSAAYVTMRAGNSPNGQQRYARELRKQSGPRSRIHLSRERTRCRPVYSRHLTLYVEIMQQDEKPKTKWHLLGDTVTSKGYIQIYSKW